MKIYPDPELPDVKVEWLDQDCENGSEVAVSLIGVDTPASRIDKVVACTDVTYTFVDVARERFRVEGELRDQAGEVFGNAQQDVDLRNGFDVTAFLYFGSFDNFRVRWTFDMGASCQSLAADTVLIVFSNLDGQVAWGLELPCDLGVVSTTMPTGTYTVHAEATADSSTVALSPASAPLTIMPKGIADAGTLVLSPCGAMCP